MQRRLDEELSAIWESGPDWPGDLDCESEMWGPEWDVDDVVTTTWAELGVTAPESWNGAIAAYLVEGDVVTSLDVPFEPGWVQAVTATDSGFQVDIIEDIGVDWRSEWEFEGGEPAQEPGAVRWEGGVDGWVLADSPGPVYGQVSGPDDAVFSIVWGEEAGSSGIRRDVDGSTGFVSAADLFADQSEEVGIWDLRSGPYGVAAVSVDYEARRSFVAFSADGVAWAVTELEGDYVDGVLVGDDGVMVFVHSFDEPDVTRVLLGRQ